MHSPWEESGRCNLVPLNFVKASAPITNRGCRQFAGMDPHDRTGTYERCVVMPRRAQRCRDDRPPWLTWEKRPVVFTSVHVRQNELSACAWRLLLMNCST